MVTSRLLRRSAAGGDDETGRHAARAHCITPEAVAAYLARDYLRLHRALELWPWEISPLPLADSGLGCDPDHPPASLPWDDSWKQAVELQRALGEAAR